MSYQAMIGNAATVPASSVDPIINFWIKPMSIELQTAQQLIIQVRRERMRELLDSERIEEEQQMKKLKASSFHVYKSCYPCSRNGLLMQRL